MDVYRILEQTSDMDRLRYLIPVWNLCIPNYSNELLTNTAVMHQFICLYSSQEAVKGNSRTHRKQPSEFKKLHSSALAQGYTSYDVRLEPWFSLASVLLNIPNSAYEVFLISSNSQNVPKFPIEVHLEMCRPVYISNTVENLVRVAWRAKIWPETHEKWIQWKWMSCQTKFLNKCTTNESYFRKKPFKISLKIFHLHL